MSVYQHQVFSMETWTDGETNVLWKAQAVVRELGS
jgi:hypothetical protein